MRCAVLQLCSVLRSAALLLPRCGVLAAACQCKAGVVAGYRAGRLGLSLALLLLALCPDTAPLFTARKSPPCPAQTTQAHSQ